MRSKLLILAFLTLFGGCSITGYTSYQKPVNEEISINAYFCPQEDCSGIVAKEIASAKNSAHCAFYSVNLDDVIDSLVEKSKTADVKLVTDNDNPTNLPFAVTDNRNGLMHDKFCVIDENTVITGSYNPTIGGLQDNNNVVIIRSTTLAKNYEAEFQEFQAGVFGKGNRVKNPVIYYANGTKKIENYFCPEDWCSDKVLKTLAKANISDNFMVFSLTDDSIGDLLVKEHSEGIDVKGVVEKSQNTNEYSEYFKLEDADIDVRYDKNPKLLHHKVFIIDRKIVITGSYNPTRNGDKVNDENILIIYDEDIAKLFLEEFERLY